MLKEQFKRLNVVLADSAYGRNDLPGWVRDSFSWLLRTVPRPAGDKGFVLLQKAVDW